MKVSDVDGTPHFSETISQTVLLHRYGFLIVIYLVTHTERASLNFATLLHVLYMVNSLIYALGASYAVKVYKK